MDPTALSAPARSSPSAFTLKRELSRTRKGGQVGTGKTLRDSRDSLVLWLTRGYSRNVLSQICRNRGPFRRVLYRHTQFADSNREPRILVDFFWRRLRKRREHQCRRRPLWSPVGPQSLPELCAVNGVFTVAVVAMLLGDLLIYLLGRLVGWQLLSFLCMLSISPETCVRQLPQRAGLARQTIPGSSPAHEPFR